MTTLGPLSAGSSPTHPGAVHHHPSLLMHRNNGHGGPGIMSPDSEDDAGFHLTAMTNSSSAPFKQEVAEGTIDNNAYT